LGNTEHTLLLMEQRCGHLAKVVIRTAQEESKSPMKDKATGIHLTQPMGKKNKSTEHKWEEQGAKILQGCQENQR
jgi:hypothetical protein